MRRGLVLLLLASCGAEERSVVLRFPSEEARAVVRRVRVEVIDNEVLPRTCVEGFLGTAALGEEPASGPRRVLDERCAEDDVMPCASDWLDGLGLTGLPAANGIVYVRAYASVAADAPPIFEGCSADFGPDAGGSTPIPLAPVFPESTRLELLTPPRLVLSPGASSATRFALRADNPASTAGARRSYGLPAASVDVEIAAGSGTLGQEGLRQLRARTDADGRLSVEFTAGEPGAARLRASLGPGVEAEIEVTVLPPIALGGRGVISLPSEPIALDLLESGDLAVAVCEGEGRCALPARLPENELLGQASLVIVEQPLGGASVETVARDLGRLPVDVAGFNGGVAVLSARTRSCLPVSCPSDGGACRCELPDGARCVCEQSELVLLRATPEAWEVELRHVTTASTAARLAVFPEEGRPPRLAVAFRGRIGSQPPCRGPCDCPFAERCLLESGRCEDRDQVVEILEDRGGPRLFDGARCGCLDKEVSCLPPIPDATSCADGGLEQRFEDECGRLGSRWVPAGPLLTPTTPFDFEVAVLREPDPDLVLGGIGRAELVSGRFWRWSHVESRVLDDRLDAIAVAQIDPRLDIGPAPLDLAFWSSTPCGDTPCPSFGTAASDRGCFGVLASAGAESAFSVPIDEPRYCRRRGLDFEARDGCLTDADGDGALDAVSVGEDRLVLFRGDGAGGFAEQGTDFQLAGSVAAVECRDLDDDQRSEVFVLEREPPGIEVVEVEAP